jgi:hypothetical protein
MAPAESKDMGVIMPGKKAHTVDAPTEFVDLYARGESFERALKSLTKKTKQELPASYDKIESKISDFDTCLKYVTKEKIVFYFEFTETLESILIVCKNRRDFNATVGKNIIGDLYDLYRDYISFLLYPFLETLDGGDIDHEKEKYTRSIENKMRYSTIKMAEIKEKMTRYNFIPTIEELDNEICGVLRGRSRNLDTRLLRR